MSILASVSLSVLSQLYISMNSIKMIDPFQSIPFKVIVLLTRFFPSSFRDSRPSLQPVQWLHERQGAANSLQYTNGDFSTHAVPCATPLQLTLWEVWRLCVEERGRARTQVRVIFLVLLKLLLHLPLDSLHLVMHTHAVPTYKHCGQL